MLHGLWSIIPHFSDEENGAQGEMIPWQSKNRMKPTMSSGLEKNVFPESGMSLIVIATLSTGVCSEASLSQGL